MKKKHLIVFDIDGTLTDTVEIHQKAFAETLFEIGITKIEKSFGDYLHHTDSYISKVIFEQNTNHEFTLEKKIAFESKLTEKIKVQHIFEISGASKLVKKLEQETEFGVVFATGSLERAAAHKLQFVDIAFSNTQLVASDNIYERENIVLKAIENAKDYYSVDTFDRIVSVGDGLWDLKTALNLGIEFIGVGKKNKEILLHEGAKIVLEDLKNFDVLQKHT